MEMTTQLGEFIRVHGERIANLWLERIEPNLTGAAPEPRPELEKSVRDCLERVIEALKGRTEDERMTALSAAGPRLDPCLALLGYDLLIDAIRDAAVELGSETVLEGLRTLAVRVARVISEHVVEHDNVQERRAHDFIQAKLADLAFERHAAERRAALITAAFEQAPAGIGVTDGGNSLILANPHMKRLLGERPHAPLLSRRDAAHDGNARGPLGDEVLGRALKHRQTLKHELVELDRPGRGKLMLDVSAAPLSGSEVPSAVLLVQEAAEQRRQPQHLQRIWSLARDLLCVVGVDTYFKHVNPAFTQTLGHTESEFLGTSLLEFVHPEDCAATLLELRKSAQGVPTVQFENRYRCRDGSYKWLAWSATPVPEEGVAYAVARDVSDDHKVRDAQTLLTRFASLVTASLDYESTLANVVRVVVPALADWCLIDVVGSDGKLSCVEVASADPTKSSLASRLRQASPKRAEHPTLRALRSGRMSSIPEVTPDQLRSIASDPRHLELLTKIGPRSLVAVPLQVRGEMLGVLTLITAESGRRYGPEDLFLVQDLSRRAAQAIDNARLFSQAQALVAFEQRVVAVVSHDLRNPLTAIAMVVTRMLHETLEAKEQQQLLLIQRAVHRALGLVSDLLDVARARVSGGIPLHPMLGDLSDLLTRVVEEARASHPDRQIEVRVEGDVRGTWDADRMAQVATNLIVNALTYGNSGSVVTVTLRDAGDEVELSVQNFGKPIPMHAPLFDAMSRGAIPEKSNGGLGLGLFIAKQIVVAHHGSIAVKSTDADGTTFTVRLPRTFHRSTDSLDLTLPGAHPRQN